MERWAGKVAVITGASCGMGKLLCEELVKAGMIVIGLGRDTKTIQKHADELKKEKGKLIPKAVDFCPLKNDGSLYPDAKKYNHQDIKEVFEFIDKTYGAVHILCNMASQGTSPCLLEDEIGMWKYTVEINIIGPAVLCKYAIANMRKHNVKGHIINVGGTASYYTSIFMDCHFYSVTKFILRAMGDGLRMEFRANNIPIRVSHIGPGHVLTGAQDRGESKTSEVYEGFLEFAKIYGMKRSTFPRRLPIDATGDKVYTSGLLPALQAQNVIDQILGMIAADDGAEVMDVIMKPTDRKHTVLETDLYWRP
ncbi:DgyrCDS13710 [Dimorphilus gyrociliatus]|uniref:DgyrCDS13710 n=1 Tax=Dimorphilus gyrociliatus TaxID=2664684 RepID=A0A7I8WBJ0_9ANNE|nr:DgyrCDS13710 [Dimorphilus gyrociliatus]